MVKIQHPIIADQGRLANSKHIFKQLRTENYTVE
jgi:hypothetical protein